MLIFAGFLTLSIWAYLLLGHGNFWRIDRLLPWPAQALSAPVSVVAVVPARNEADVVAECITSLLSQTIPIRVVLVDDNSTDGTAGIARAAAQASQKNDQLTLVAGSPLPRGWSGKLWAVHQGVMKANEFAPDYLLLTDADIRHSRENVSMLATLAQQGRFDLVSFMVRLHCQTLAEKALIPAFVFFFFMLYPPEWIRDARRKTAGAAGGCMFIRRTALEKAGGIEAIRAEIIDDCALARRIRSSGGKVWLGVAPETESLRPYRTFAEIGSMISRSAFNQLHHSILLLAFSLIGLLITYVLPLVLAFSGHAAPAWCGLISWILMALCFLPTLKLYRLHPLWSLALPAIAIFYMGATLHSAIMYWTGKGGQWKGRVQDPSGEVQKM
jgi:hopene-associated glycosyltransferase HpnB